jgi:hypothetical protein
MRRQAAHVSLSVGTQMTRRSVAPKRRAKSLAVREGTMDGETSIVGRED